MLPLTDERGSSAALPEALTTRLRCHGLLESLVRSGEDIVDIVVLDEYTHDVVVRVTAELWAVYDST